MVGQFGREVENAIIGKIEERLRQQFDSMVIERLIYGSSPGGSAIFIGTEDTPHWTDRVSRDYEINEAYRGIKIYFSGEGIYLDPSKEEYIDPDEKKSLCLVHDEFIYVPLANPDFIDVIVQECEAQLLSPEK